MMITPPTGTESNKHVPQRLIIINNPHNPTGKILSHADFEALEQLMDKFRDYSYFQMKYMNTLLSKKSIFQHTAELN
jgi:methionine aminotransferase